MEDKKRSLKFLLFLFFAVLEVCFLSAEPVSAEEWREFYSNARALSMGNSSVAVTNDETAILLNPAALGRLRDQYGTLVDPEIDTSATNSNLSQISGLGNLSIEKAATLTANNRDSYSHNRTQIFPSYVRKYFGIGILYRNTLDAEMNTAGNSLYVNYRNDVALVGGMSVRFFDGRIKLGINGKIINRIEVQNPTVDPAGALDMTTIGAAEGTALSSDAGILLAAPWTWLPTIGAVVHDLGGTIFDKRNGLRLVTATNPTKVEQTIDVGMAVFPIHSRSWRSSWTIEYKDVNNGRQDPDTAKRTHAGIELNWNDIFFIRAGYNQRYWTGGLELAGEYFQLQLTTYSEEIGTETAPREDRRYAAKFAFRF